MNIQEEKIDLQKIARKTICTKDVTILIALLPTFVVFCHFFVYSLPFVYYNFTYKKSLLQKMVTVRAWHKSHRKICEQTDFEQGNVM